MEEEAYIQSMCAMNADTQNNILSMAVESQRLDLERSRMLLEEQRATIVEKTAQLVEEVSFLHSCLYQTRNLSDGDRLMYESACDALNMLDPSHPENY